MTSVITIQDPLGRPPGVEAPDQTEHGVKVTRAMVLDTPAVLAMLARCSPMTLFRRFHGPSDGVAYTRALLDRQPSDETLAAWNRSACIGLATLGRDEEGIAHLGVLVEDAWQRRGVGGRLVGALVEGARAKGASRLHADVLADDWPMLRALRRVGPLTISFELGTLAVDIDLGGGTRSGLR
jgi:GNAT superfamily N-acetyltransferase